MTIIEESRLFIFFFKRRYDLVTLMTVERHNLSALSIALVLALSGAVHASESCPENFSSLGGLAQAIASERMLRLRSKGYDEKLAERLVVRDPELAVRIINDPYGRPIVVGVEPADKNGPAGKVYRGITIHPLKYNPKLQSAQHQEQFWFGYMGAAEDHAWQLPGNRRNQLNKPERLKGSFGILIEMQIPTFAAHHHYATKPPMTAFYTRKDIPDDTLFITRVGVFDLSRPINAIGPPYRNVRWVATWYDYDEFFDAYGNVKPHADWKLPSYQGL